MEVIDFRRDCAQPITQFESSGAHSVKLGAGQGAAHVYCLYLAPGSRIGAHKAGFGQLFLVVDGVAWVAGADGQPVELGQGQGARFECGEIHAKGSVRGATVLMVQIAELAPDEKRS